MQLALWRLLLDEELPGFIRDALTIADLSASQDTAARALRRAACGLVEAFGLTLAEAAELMAVEVGFPGCFEPRLRAA